MSSAFGFCIPGRTILLLTRRHHGELRNAGIKDGAEKGRQKEEEEEVETKTKRLKKKCRMVERKTEVGRSSREVKVMEEKRVETRLQ